MQPRSVAFELGPYQLSERIGEGGSGQVFRATGPSGTVAVKMLAAAASELDDAARARFSREIVALGQLSHPNLVRMLDHGIDAELSGPYIVLPMLAGTHLRALCGGRPLCPEAALLLVQPIVHATAALHAAGFVHRDLKPENAIAAPDGAITVIDLGLAWRDGMTHHTDTGAAVGSVGYMAPEQIEGREVTAAADVWALGVMLYELIAGKRPFARARPAEEAAAALLGVYPRLAAADRRAGDELSRLVARCLAIDPRARPSASELASAIDASIEWTDDVAGERAPVVADPAAYQARVAAFRVGRIERVAREAIEAGKPFEALSACDRGLAYAPDHPSLLALVAQAEAVTVERAPAAVTAPVAPRRRRWPWLAAGLAAVVVLVGVGLATRLSEPAEVTADPWAAERPASPTTTVKFEGPSDEDRAMAKDFVSIFGRAIDSSDAHAQSKSKAPTAADKELMRDTLSLFGRMIERADTKPAK